MMEEEEDTLFDQEGLLGERSSERSGELEWKKKIYKTAALSLAFFSLGCCVAIPGATLLDLGERVGRDTEHMTFIATARSAGYLIGSVFGGILSDCFDHQLVLFYTLALTSLATAVIPWCTVLYALTSMIGVQGIALGVLDTGGNVFCIHIWGKKSPPYMQFLHFSFAFGAFLAPLIAHPFLLNSIAEFSSNNSKSSNVSIKALLPYATSDHLAGGRARRDMTLNHNPAPYLDREEDLALLPLAPRHRRELTSLSGNLTDSSNSTSLSSNSSVMTNESFTQTNPVSLQTEATKVRPKKPEVVNPLSKEHSDSHLLNNILKDLKKNPITSEEDNDKEKKEENKNPPDLATDPTLMNISNSEPKSIDISTTSNSISGSLANNSKTEQGNPSSTSTQTSTSSSTTTSSTTTTIQPSSTTSVSPKTISSTVSVNTDSSNSDKGISSSHESDGSEKHDQTTDLNNSSIYHNDTALNKPETWKDLVYDMLETMRHMSKIQFAYLIIGFFLISNAGFFLGLFCKDKLSGYRLTALSHEDLTRPPDSPCFVGTLLCLLFIFFLFYVGMEQTYGILLTTFAVEFPSTIWTPAQGATLTAVFWGCVALGRFISIGVSRFFKAPCMLVTNLTLTLLGAILLSFALRTAWFVLWIGTVLLGLGMSSLFPTTISWTDSYYPLTGKAAAVFVAGSGIGQMTIPVLTGYLYQNVDPMSLMYVVLSLSILLCLVYTCLQVVASRRGNSRGASRSYSGFMRLDTTEDMADSLDMDLIQAGAMDRPLSLREEDSRRKENGVNEEYEVTEFSKLVELSD